MAELSIFWDQLLQLIEEGKVVPVVGQDLLTLPESSGHSRLATSWITRGKPAAAPLPHASRLAYAAFDTDGRRLLTYSLRVDGQENLARVWQVLIDSGSSADVALLAEIAEPVAGHRIK